MGITVRSRGQAGEILVEDERDDGTFVFLICRPWDSGPATGVLVGPAEPPDPDRDLQGRFPIQGVIGEPEPFRIVIDTSQLPAGPLQFNSDRFIAAAREASASGTERVRLTLNNARQWGLVEAQASA